MRVTSLLRVFQSVLIRAREGPMRRTRSERPERIMMTLTGSSEEQLFISEMQPITTHQSQLAVTLQRHQ